MRHNQERLPRFPQAVNLYVTYRCRSRCSHCFLVQNNKLDRHELTREAVFSVIDQLSAGNVYLLIISGGEPLLHPHFFDIVKHANQNDMLPLVAITGTHVTDQDIAQYVAADVPTVQLSLDGASPSRNDRMRGTGSFDDIMSTITRFQSAGINVNLAICLHQGNVADLTNFFELSLRLKISRIKLGLYKSFSIHASEKELSETQIAEVLEKSRSFILGNGLTVDWIASPTVDIWTSERKLQRSELPPLTIGADGIMTAGDSGPEIGRLDMAPLGEQYGAYVNKKIQSFFDATLKKTGIEYGLSEIIEVKNLGANALVFQHDGKFSAYVEKGLPRSIKFFSVLHEIGHIATHTMKLSPRTLHDEKAELTANLWALHRLKSNLRPEVLSFYESLARQSEAMLYQQLANNLEIDLIGYYS